MRTAILSCALCALCSGATAHADSFQERDLFGVDVQTVWEPNNRDAFGAGPVFRFETFSSRLPSWLAMVTRAGVFADSADRVFSHGVFGLQVRPGGNGAYVSLEGGLTIATELFMEQEHRYRIDFTGAGALGYHVGHWDLRATVLAGGLFEGPVWLFSLGRDFVRIDSSITRSAL